MNRFRDLSNNQESRRSFNFRKDVSNNRFRQSSSLRVSSNNTVNLPRNNRWKRDDEAPKTRNNFTRQPSKLQRYHSRPTPHLEPYEINSKFVDTKSMAIGFEQITSKPKQNKKKKKKKKGTAHLVEPQEKSHLAVKKYSKKYELSNDEDDKLNASIINQYKYEIIEESSEGEEGNVEDEPLQEQ